MKTNMNIHYDEEADFLEIRVGDSTSGYFNELGDDIFERVEEKTGKTTGIAIFNFKKRTKKLADIEFSVPLKVELSA